MANDRIELSAEGEIVGVDFRRWAKLRANNEMNMMPKVGIEPTRA